MKKEQSLTDKDIHQHLHDAFAGKEGYQLRRDLRRTYTVKGQPRERPLKFLRPELYCYAYPQYFATMPASQPLTETVTARVVNAGGAPSTNTIVRLQMRYGDGSVDEIRQTIGLQAGESRDIPFYFSAQDKARDYVLSCFDPLHDPLTEGQVTAASKLSKANYLPDVTDLPPGVYVPYWYFWREHGVAPDGTLTPALIPTWQLRDADPPPGTVALNPNQRYWATTAATPAPRSELHQTATLRGPWSWGDADLLSVLDAGDLLAALDVLVYLEPGSQAASASVGLDALTDDMTVLDSLQLEVPPERGSWLRLNAAFTVPAATHTLRCRLIAAKRDHPDAGNVFFDEGVLTLTHRQVFVSGRIYSF